MDLICYKQGRTNQAGGYQAGVRKVSDRVQTLDFIKAEFCLFRDLIDGISGEAALKGKGAQQIQSLKTTSHRQ